MNIMLGDLSVSDMEKRLGVTFPTELVEYMQSRHQAVASNIQPGKWHCFNVPFLLLCGDRETATEIDKHLAPLELKCQLQISLQKT